MIKLSVISILLIEYGGIKILLPKVVSTLKHFQQVPDGKPLGKSLLSCFGGC